MGNYTYLCCCLNHCSLAQFASSIRSTVVLAVHVHCANEVCIDGDRSVVRDIALQWHPEQARVCAILDDDVDEMYQSKSTITHVFCRRHGKAHEKT